MVGAKTNCLLDYDVMTVGETPFTHDECTLAEYGLPKNKELNMLFQFEIMDLDSPPEVPLKRRQWKLSELKSIISKWQNFRREEGFWNTSVICALFSAPWLIYACIKCFHRKPRPFARGI